MTPKLPIHLPPHLSINFLKSYLNAGQLDRARELFDKIPHPDLRSLTVLICGYTKQGLSKESISLYWKLRREKDLKPDRLVLLSVAKACGHSSDLDKAKGIHEEAIKFGLDSDLLLGNVLVDTYGKCGFSEGARRVFNDIPEKDVVSWTSLVAAYVNCRLPIEALQAFRDMLSSGMKPNSVTLSTVLRVCSGLKALNPGKEIHCFVLRNAIEDDAFIGSGLADVYANCSSTQQARIAFDSIPRKDIVSWIVILTAYFSDGNSEEALKLFEQMKSERVAMSSASWNCMISGFAQNGRTEQACEMLAQMQRLGFKPNKITIASILPAYTNLESLRGGREIHGYIFRHKFVDDMVVMTALVLMYAKCGDLDKSRGVFSQMPRKDTVAWNTMILANSMHGCGKEALSLFHQMVELGVRPNSVTFTVVLSGCSHSRLVDEGRSIFNSMSRDHELRPDADHHACMVDILCRAGHLKEAYEFIQNMPMEPTASAWGALLASSRVYKNVEFGKIAAEHLFEIEPENPGNYILLSNMLVAARMWDEASKIRTLMRDRMRGRGIAKVPGCSWIQIKNKIYTFVKGDDRNAQRDEIYGFLKDMGERMKREGYLPNTDYVLQDVDREEKEENLCSHSEKLAVAFGVLNLNGESVIRVFKNLRICGDCHNAIKFMAKIIQVQIIVRDNVRFHHFRDGSCSCRDLW
uniref:Pentatricopeptide repeat-containing protein At2g29760, chloroplastic n=1 Tax=Elaeis guineensis var. tenera TaxID=51953 RepID=A0A6I9QEN5_ELAGV|nr:pentatricopeptide repeat-containing protein At2g29760, chloroplastic [Elaeis guineensis]